jgi:hypothetical protein
MVYLRAVSPALCELMDAAVASAPTSTAATATRDFIERRLHSLVHTQTPSQLDNALWIFLVAQTQLLLRHNRHCGEEGDAQQRTGPQASLPPSLQLPSSVEAVQDAVRWYGGEWDASPDPASIDAKKAAPTTPPSRNGAAAQPSPKRATLFSTNPARQHDAARQASARLDELLRHRYQPPPPPPAASVATIDSAESAATHKPATGPLATAYLALAALSNSKRAAALRQPRSLVLVVRDLESLWSLVYLCKQLRRHQLRKERLLKGDEDVSPVVDATAARSAMPAKPAEEPISVCFHDYDLLLPWDLVCTVLSSSTEGDQRREEKTPLTMAAVAARCRSCSDQAHHTSKQVPSHGVDGTTPPRLPPPSLALVINPAVTVVEDNPDRLRKNARIDAIDEAANKYYYTLLATRAHGQAGSVSRGSATTITAAGSTYAASSGAAAAHQEAVRSSLAAMDLDDYGVLDPSRMRATVQPPAASATHGRGMRGGESGMGERSAKSYALFLRDASIGFDIQIMALTGAGVGYYMGYLRGVATEWCTLYAVVGLATMMLVDAVLIMIRMGRQDEAVLRARKRIRRHRERLEREGEKLVQAMQHAAATTAPPTEETNPGNVISQESAARASTAAAAEAAPSAEVDAYTKKHQ